MTLGAANGAGSGGKVSIELAVCYGVSKVVAITPEGEAVPFIVCRWNPLDNYLTLFGGSVH